ncbi:MAG: cupin domain-containing protein [Phycisphaerae bacterium]
MSYQQYLKHVDSPGVLFSYEQTAGAMQLAAVAGHGTIEPTQRAVTVNGIRGSGRIGSFDFAQEDFLYLPAGWNQPIDYRIDGLLLVCQYAPVRDVPELARGPILIPPGRASGYIRVQYRGLSHGWGGDFAGFNPQGITYVDKLWGLSRDVLAQELTIPPGHIVPCHNHHRLGLPPDGRHAWQAYYVWQGSARVDIGRSLSDIQTLQIGPGDVLIYPNGVAHNVIAGPQGCRYIFLEKKSVDDPLNLDLDSEKDYERRLSSRLDMDLASFIRLELARLAAADSA